VLSCVISVLRRATSRTGEFLGRSLKVAVPLTLIIIAFSGSLQRTWTTGVITLLAWLLLLAVTFFFYVGYTLVRRAHDPVCGPRTFTSRLVVLTKSVSSCSTEIRYLPGSAA